MVVILIIAVVVSIGIKLTKTKLDNITSYTYYTAYKTIDAVTKEMLRDFRYDDEDYTSWLHKLFPVAFAEDCFYKSGSQCYNYDTVDACTVKNFNCSAQIGKNGITSNMCTQGVYHAYGLYKYHNYYVSGRVSFGGSHSGFFEKLNNVLPEGWYELFEYVSGHEDCFSGAVRMNKSLGFSFGSVNCAMAVAEELCQNNGKFIYYYYKNIEPEPEPEPESCIPAPCIGGNEFDTATCTCVCNKTEPAIIPCGKEWSETQCGLVDRSPWPPLCPLGQEFNQKEEICGCVPIPQTLPRSGANYCKLFVSYANTAQLAEDAECKGEAIADNQTEFTFDDADLILRNGMILYNVSQDPEPIDMLSGNSKGRTYNKEDGTEIDIDEWGYTLYIDIDGSNSGKGKLWEDVYKFYVTLSGTVIPAYDEDNEGTAGGDSKLHLQISVFDEFVDNNGRHTEWITKSRTFKDSACTMGYVHSTTEYCSGVVVSPQCTQQNHDCRLKTIMPVKFFGY